MSGRDCRSPRKRKDSDSAAADGVDNLDLIAFVQHVANMHAARDDFAIDLDRYPAVAVTGFLQQLGDSDSLGTVTRTAIEHDLHSHHCSPFREPLKTWGESGRCAACQWSTERAKSIELARLGFSPFTIYSAKGAI